MQVYRVSSVLNSLKNCFEACYFGVAHTAHVMLGLDWVDGRSSFMGITVLIGDQQITHTGVQSGFRHEAFAKFSGDYVNFGEPVTIELHMLFIGWIRGFVLMERGFVQEKKLNKISFFHLL